MSEEYWWDASSWDDDYQEAPDMICKKCKKRTVSYHRDVHIITKGKRTMIKTRCVICDTKRCRFISEEEEGLYG